MKLKEKEAEKDTEKQYYKRLSGRLFFSRTGDLRYVDDVYLNSESIKHNKALLVFLPEGLL